MLCRVKIEHVIDQSPLKECAGPGQDCESCPCDLGGPVEVENAEGFTDLPVALGRCVEGGWGSPSSRLQVAGRVFTSWHRNMWNIGDMKIQSGEGFFNDS